MTATPSDLEGFRSLLIEKIGFRLEDDKLPFLAKLLAERMLNTKASTTSAYLEQVAASPIEIAELARTLTVSETYFLRNRGQLRAFESLLKERESRGMTELRVLSAGSSSGEEAYSLAILLRETVANLDGWTVSILGVDVNPDVIEKAKAASYSPWSLRETPDAIRQKYFRKDGSRFVLTDNIRQMVRFESHNLVHPRAELFRRQRYELVFCRNVLMYFSAEAAHRVIANISTSLAPDGHLFVGHAETLRGLSQDFHLCQTHGTFYYQRRSAEEETARASSQITPVLAPAPAAQEQVASPSSQELPWFEAIAQASRRIQRLSQGNKVAVENRQTNRAPVAPPELPVKDLAPALDMLKQERFQEALRLLASDPASTSGQASPDEQLLRAMLLASTDQLSAAAALCGKLLAVDELNAGAHYIMAICCEHAEDRAGAIEHSQAASYLDNNFAMPHLQLGRLARRMGNASSARRELSLALRLLACEDAARITLFGGGFGRDVLMQLCRAELAACGADQ